MNLKLILQILFGLGVWTFLSWLASNGWRDKDDALFVLLMPIALVGALGVGFCIILFLYWLY